MNWDAIGAIAEAAGAVGVIASLIYVGISIRHSAEVVRGESLQKFIDARIESIDRLSAPGNVEIYHRGRQSYKDLTAAEKERFTALVGPYLAVSEFGISAYERGLIKPGTFESSKRDIKRQFEFPGVHEWWAEERSIFADDFQEFVDQLVGPPAA
jgi:hypothetical protein